MRILVVEDERRMADFIERCLKEQHYAVDVARTMEQGSFLSGTNPYDLIILDVMLPDGDGVALCKQIRSSQIKSPVLMLTSKAEVRDKVRGLDSGADDYLTKPFSPDEFLARVRALCRKEREGRVALLKVADLEIDKIAHTVRRSGKEIQLTAREFALLEHFMLNVNAVVTRTALSEHVWAESYNPFTNVVDVCVNRLRAKIDKGYPKPLIHSIRGVGYILKS